MHLSAHEDGRQLVLLDQHTKRYRSAPTKAIRKRFLWLSSACRQDKNAQRDRAQKDQGMPAKHTCAGAGAHTAAATSGCSLVAFAGAALGALSGASLAATDARCSNISLSCKRGPADAGGVGVVNWPRRHRLRRARSRKKLRFARMWRVWLRIPQPNRAGGTGSARLLAVAASFCRGSTA